MLKMMDANSAVTKAEEQLEVQKQMLEALSKNEGRQGSDIPEPVGVASETSESSTEGDSLDSLDADMDLS
jgi:hypothetical protein